MVVPSCLILPILCFFLGYMCIHDHNLCTFSSHGPQKSAHHTLQFDIHVSSIISRLCCGIPSEVVPSFQFGSGADRSVATGPFWLETMTLFSVLGTDVHFSGDESGMQWEDYVFELQNAVEWSTGQPVSKLSTICWRRQPLVVRRSS